MVVCKTTSFLSFPHSSSLYGHSFHSSHRTSHTTPPSLHPSFCFPFNFVLPSFCSPFFSSALIGCLEWAIHSPRSSSSHLFPSFFSSYPLLLSLLPLSLSHHLSLYLFCPFFLFPLLLLNSLSLAYMAYM